jgi:hypothetical protein
MAKRITHTNNQLCKFVEALGVTKDLTVYSYKDLIYINIEFILPVLLVDIKWFMSNSKTPTHYIKINGTTYINKYGMTKLIGQSNQPASYKLQDYLYELFYQVETKGYADQSLDSRADLIKLTNQIDTYKEVNMTITQQLEDLNAQIECLRSDLSVSDQEIAILKSQNAALEIAAQNSDHFQNIAVKLAKCVRYKSRKPIPEAFDASLDIEELDTDNKEEMENIIEEATDAKQELKTLLTPKVIKRATKNDADRKKPSSKAVVVSAKITKAPNYYYIMREVKESAKDSYQWHLTDVRPENDQTIKSEDYLWGATTSFPYPFLHYRTLKLSNDKRDAIILFLSLSDYPEEIIENMFSIIANT